MASFLDNFSQLPPQYRGGSGPALAEPAVEEEPPVAAAPAPAAAAGPALSEPTPAAGGEVAIAPEAVATFEESVEASKTAPEEEVNRMATVLDDVMGPQSYVDAFKELYDKIQPQKDIEEYKLTDRQKGLAIMDFGLRMMAHGQDSTFAGAVGKAGLETRAATEALKDREYQKELSKQKRDLAVTGSALDQYFEDRSDTELEWSDKGLMNINRTTGLAQPVRGVEGKPLQPGATPGGFGSRPTEKQWLYQMAIDLGYSKDQALGISKGGMTRTQAEQEAVEFVNTQLEKREEVYIPGKGSVPKNKMTDSDFAAYVNYYADMMMSVGQGMQGPALGPAGPVAGKAVAPPPEPPAADNRKDLGEIL